MAVKAVLVAFRTGMVVSDVRGRMDMDETDQSLSIMIPGLTGNVAPPYLKEVSHELVCSLKMLPVDCADN